MVTSVVNSVKVGARCDKMVIVRVVEECFKLSTHIQLMSLVSENENYDDQLKIKQHISLKCSYKNLHLFQLLKRRKENLATIYNFLVSTI